MSKKSTSRGSARHASAPRSAAAPRKKPRRSARAARRVPWALVALAGGALVVAVSPLRAVAREAHAAVMEAVAASRRADAHRALIERYAQRYGISPELAHAIDRAADAEGIDVDLAFRLVRVESGFHERAVSSAGALGLTQLMPATADWLQPGITREQIFQRDTNLRLGFRYLRQLLAQYDGRVDEALHAYNRGPGTVQRIRDAGGDPANGYADRVMDRGRREPYRGDGLPSDPLLHRPW